MADAASCRAAALPRYSQFRPQSSGASQGCWSPGRWGEPLSRLREHRGSVGSSTHLCGRHGDVQDARPFLGGLESWRGPRRSAQTLPLRIDGALTPWRRFASTVADRRRVQPAAMLAISHLLTPFCFQAWKIPQFCFLNHRLTSINNNKRAH